MLGQQPGHEGRQLERDVEHDTIRQHAEPPDRYGSCGETSCTGGSALSRGSPAMSACLPIWGATPGSPLLRKPHYPGSSYVDWAGADGYSWTSERSDSSPNSFSGSSHPSAGGVCQPASRHSRAKMVSLRRHLEPTPPLFIQVYCGPRANFAAIRKVVYFGSVCKEFGRYFNCKLTWSSPAPAASCARADDRYSVPDIKVSSVARHAFDGGQCHVRTTAAG